MNATPPPGQWIAVGLYVHPTDADGNPASPPICRSAEHAAYIATLPDMHRRYLAAAADAAEMLAYANSLESADCRNGDIIRSQLAQIAGLERRVLWWRVAAMVAGFLSIIFAVTFWSAYAAH